jgi:hypothetical protein
MPATPLRRAKVATEEWNHEGRRRSLVMSTRWPASACADGPYFRVPVDGRAVTGDSDTSRTALVEACFVAAGNARSLGNHDLAVTAARRGQDTAGRLDDPALPAFAAMTATSALSRTGARHRAQRIATQALTAVADADPTIEDTAAAEAAAILVRAGERSSLVSVHRGGTR